jgi:broad specificity phosphatase PhoE
MPQTTILIRHADVPAGGGDQALSAGGTVRAQALRRVLRDAGISAIVVSHFKRTQQTAAPLAAHLGLVPRVAEDVAGAVAAILALQPDAVALVVGHTTTLPGISSGLGGPVLPAIKPQEFDHLFVQAGRRVTHLRYGA